ncbi:MAG: DUF5671 domain-containing protein [Patescibacteria group bacterium]
MDTNTNSQVKIHTSAADFFLHLGVIVSLYVGVVSILNLLFSLINYVYPNGPVGEYASSQSISIPVASLLIVVPVYIFLSWLLNRDYSSHPEKRTLGVRKWLVYLTLFVAGIVIVVDLIVLVFKFVNGDIITTGFLLKVTAVFLILLSVFSYYLADLKNKVSGSKNKLYAILLSLSVLTVIALGFSILGSPAKQRMLKEDQQRLFSLQSIQSEVITYWQQKETLPKELSNLEDSLSYFTLPTKLGPYEYLITGPLSFELCGTFSLKSEEDFSGRPSFAPYPEGNWSHEKGRACFSRTIDPDRFPPFKGAPVYR